MSFREWSNQVDAMQRKQRRWNKIKKLLLLIF